MPRGSFIWHYASFAFQESFGRFVSARRSTVKVSGPISAARPVFAEDGLEGTEALAEGDLLVVGQPLLGEDEDGVAVEGLPHLAEVSAIEQAREIEPGH